MTPEIHSTPTEPPPQPDLQPTEATVQAEGPSPAEAPPGTPADTAPASVPATAPAAEAHATPDAAHRSPAEVGRLLAERFPALFSAGTAKPIKLRIQADLQTRAPGLIGRRSLSIFLQRHTTTTAYLKALVAAEHRFDLDGQPAGEVATEHRAAAQVELDRRRQLVAERRAAERGNRPKPVARTDLADAVPGREPQAPQEARRPPSGRRAAAEGRPSRQGPAPGPGREARGPARNAPRDAARRTAREPGPAAARDPARTADRAPGRPQRPPEAERPDASPDAAARRSRSMLLQAFEASPLSKANFCALKGLRETDFDALIAEARADRAARSA